MKLLILLLSALSAAAQHSLPAFKSPAIAAASDEAELALKQFTVRPGFQLQLFAAEPLLAHPVAFAIDEKNRFYISESFRVGEQVTDIRKHMNWLDEELASTNTAQLRQLIQKYMVNGDFMTAETERIQLLEDTDSDGKADKSTVFAEGFNDLESGIASGVLPRKGDVWFTCIPDLWRLRDSNGDGKADERKSLQHGYAVRFGFYGHDLHGLRFGPDGKLYFSIGDRGLNVLAPDGRRISAPECGSVLRCNPDGTQLELFATGLRNPQELAFDDYGNLFTGDNNSDGGDEARWVHLVEGGDSGWRIGYQFITSPVARGPWNAEKMWRPQNHEQPAFILPPITNLASGPSGLTYSPGTGLPPELARHFFLADFRGAGAQSVVRSFALKPRGASYEVIDHQPFISGILATDVEFGMDGALYISDWVEGWGKTGKGRLYRAVHAQSAADSVVKRTRQLMAEGFEARTIGELAELLAWPDQRVRQEAQFELAARGFDSTKVLTKVAQANSNPLARLHALWALGQIHSGHLHKNAKRSAEILKPLIPLLKDPDQEVQAQAAKVLGDAACVAASTELARLVVNPNVPRVQFFAADALGRIGGKAALGALLEMLRQNEDRDPYLRHAGVMALGRLTDDSTLHKLAQDRSPAVRMAALLSMRRRHSPGMTVFLKDAEPRIVLEAARAIYDLPIEKAMPELAALIRRPIDSAPLLRRVINANFRIGQSANAAALAQLANVGSASEAGRLEALHALSEWAKPSGRDGVTGLWRPLPERDPALASSAIRPILDNLLADTSASIRMAAIGLARKYKLPSPALALLVKSESADPTLRTEALRALADLDDPKLPELLNQAMAGSSEPLRIAATGLMVKRNPAGAVGLLTSKMQSGSTSEKQGCLLALSGINDPSVEQLIDRQMELLLAGKLDAGLQLELLEAAGKHPSGAIRAKAERFESSRPKNEIGQYVESLFGGNPIQGRKIFFEKQEASCNRCHKVDGQGGDVGPELSLTLTNRSREYLLESIVAPNKTIAPGFENVTVVLKNQALHSGTVKTETADELTLTSLEDGPVTVAKAEIATRKSGLSGMQQDLGQLLTKRDLRDLVEFLATLKK